MKRSFLMMTLVALSVVASACSCTCVANITGLSHDKAEKAAKAWATQMGLELKGVSCTSVDSDGDGYVSCSAAVVKSDGDIDIIPIECAAALTLNDGCRAARVISTKPVQ